MPRYQYLTLPTLLFAASFFAQSTFATTKCESFINHELKLIGTDSTLSRTGKCFNRSSNANGSDVTIFQKVAPRSGCNKEPGGYLMPAWNQYSAFGVRIHNGAGKMRVETLFSYGQDQSMDKRQYDLKSSPKIIYELSENCEIERVILPASDGTDQTQVEWNATVCKNLQPTRDLSKSSKDDQAIREGCKHLLANYASFLAKPSDQAVSPNKGATRATKP